MPTRTRTFGAVVGEMGPESLMIDVAAPPADVAQQKLMLRELMPAE